ncbi:MAG: oligosaccharide repeat unit polymerase [Alcaligenaceae bacterium]|nr:MAG: oligosaccharide repeat unit polymerase [Alcaligenaceae bacterium]
MLEVLVFITFLGLLISNRRGMGVVNPFQIYFLIWFLLIFGYYLSAANFIPVSFEFLLLILTAKAAAFLILLVIGTLRLNSSKLTHTAITIAPRDRLLLIAQISTWIAMPFAYQQANSLSGGADIFTVQGYMQLRGAMTDEGQGFGLLSYFSTLSYVISSIRCLVYARDRSGKLLLILALATSLFFAYIGTGRTGVLLLVVLIVIPLMMLRLIGAKGVWISFASLIGMFLLVAAMTAKGISVEAGFIENIESLFQNLRGYTIAPFLAFSQLEASGLPVSGGVNSFRFLIALVSAAGVLGIEPVALIRGYAFVPDPTNVYTVYDVYFRDFSYFGVVVPPFFLIVHWWLYRRSMRFGSRWIFYYSASVYPLVMQFFQDQYLSLLSTWLQIGFWYWIFLQSPRQSQKYLSNRRFT